MDAVPIQAKLYFAKHVVKVLTDGARGATFALDCCEFGEQLFDTGTYSQSRILAFVAWAERAFPELIVKHVSQPYDPTECTEHLSWAAKKMI